MQIPYSNPNRVKNYYLKGILICLGILIQGSILSQTTCYYSCIITRDSIAKYLDDANVKNFVLQPYKFKGAAACGYSISLLINPTENGHKPATGLTKKFLKGLTRDHTEPNAVYFSNYYIPRGDLEDAFDKNEYKKIRFTPVPRSDEGVAYRVYVMLKGTDEFIELEAAEDGLLPKSLEPKLNPSPPALRREF